MQAANGAGRMADEGCMLHRSKGNELPSLVDADFYVRQLYRQILL